MNIRRSIPIHGTMRALLPLFLAATVIFLLSLQHRSSAGPASLENGDINGNGTRDVGDILLLLEFLYQGGGAPVEIETDPELPPIGTVIDWFPPGFGAPVPNGYQLCNGSLITDQDSPLEGQFTPLISQRIVRGAPTVAEIGNQGGANGHGHDPDPDQVHGHDPVTWPTNTTLNHDHLWSTYNAASGAWRDGNGTTIADLSAGDGVGNEGTGQNLLGDSTGSSRFLDTSLDGAHNHGVLDLTVEPAQAFSSGGNTQVRWIAVTKIIRIK